MTHPTKIAAWISTAAVLGLSLVSGPLPATATSSPPPFMTYQSFLTDKNGDPLGKDAPKNYDVIFRIYNDQSSGNSLWAEQQTVTVDKGYFSVLLGEGSPLSGANPTLDNLFTPTTGDLSDRYVEMTVKGIGSGTPAADVVIKPRLRLMTSPYAFVAQKAISAASLVNGSNGQVVVVGGATGNMVGINKVAPTVALDVNGNANISGSLGVGNVSANNVTASGVFSGNGTIPLGGIIMWSGATVPPGWALCDGIASDAYGNKTPNLAGRFILGAASTTSGMGVTGGEATHTLTVAEMPAHTHNFKENGLNVSLPEQDGTGDKYDTAGAGGTGHCNTWRSATQATGSGAPHNIMPPYYTLAYIMRVK